MESLWREIWLDLRVHIIEILFLLYFTTLLTLISLVYFDELSLALVGFSLLMWVTLPWAFEERLRKIKDEHAVSGKSIDYLEYGTYFFLASSMMFMIDTIAQLLFQITPYPPSASGADALLFASFGSGVAFLIIAMTYTNNVIHTLFHPDVPPETAMARTMTITAIFTRNLGLLVALGFFGTLDIVLFVFTFPYFLSQKLTAQILIVAYGVSIFGVFFSVKEIFNRKVTGYSLIGPVLIALPWIISLILYFSR